MVVTVPRLGRRLVSSGKLGFHTESRMDAALNLYHLRRFLVQEHYTTQEKQGAHSISPAKAQRRLHFLEKHSTLSMHVYCSRRHDRSDGCKLCIFKEQSAGCSFLNFFCEGQFLSSHRQVSSHSLTKECHRSPGRHGRAVRVQRGERGKDCPALLCLEVPPICNCGVY